MNDLQIKKRVDDLIKAEDLLKQVYQNDEVRLIYVLGYISAMGLLDNMLDNLIDIVKFREEKEDVNSKH